MSTGGKAPRKRLVTEADRKYVSGSAAGAGTLPTGPSASTRADDFPAVSFPYPYRRQKEAQLKRLGSKVACLLDGTKSPGVAAKHEAYLAAQQLVAQLKAYTCWPCYEVRKAATGCGEEQQGAVPRCRDCQAVFCTHHLMGWRCRECWTAEGPGGGHSHPEYRAKQEA